MAETAHLYWDEPDWEPDYEHVEEVRPRDPVVDQAKGKIRAFFENERNGVFYKQQLEVIFEDTYFHWVTSRALSELAAEGHISAQLEALPVALAIIFYYHPL